MKRKRSRWTTVEMFCGIGGFRLAADARGIETLWANDVCPRACAVYRSRFGSDALHEGDVRTLLHSVPPHDLLTGGFPCQPFSSAGKKHGIRDPRGTLFESIVRVLDRRRPRFFVLENVKRLLTMERGSHFATILSALADLDYQVEWRLLNAMYLGLPQNRQRVFLVGSRDAAIRLASDADLGTSATETLARAKWRAIADHGQRFPNWGMARAGHFHAANLATFSASRAPVLLKEVLEPNVDGAFDFTESTRRWLGANRPVNRFVGGVEILSNQAGGARMGYTIFGIRGVAPTLTSTTSRHYERYKIGKRYRRLTNVEYARIQGFPDDHCSSASVYDQYALFGNAVPPPLAGWVLDRLITHYEFPPWRSSQT